MIIRSFDGEALEKVMQATPALTHIRCDIRDWVANEKNVALVEVGRFNFGVFEFERPGIYTGHYFFETARGRAAIDLSRVMLRQIYEHHNARIIRGLTPTDHRAAVWLTRQLGFTDQGVVETLAGPCHIFTLTREEFEDKNQ